MSSIQSIIKFIRSYKLALLNKLIYFNKIILLSFIYSYQIGLSRQINLFPFIHLNLFRSVTINIFLIRNRIRFKNQIFKKFNFQSLIFFTSNAFLVFWITLSNLIVKVTVFIIKVLPQQRHFLIAI